MNKETAGQYLPLVQALADGRQLQEKVSVDVHEQKWSDCFHPEFDRYPASNYRIKPDPREIWVNEYPAGGNHVHKSAESAEQGKMGTRAVTRRYREVLE